MINVKIQRREKSTMCAHRTSLQGSLLFGISAPVYFSSISPYFLVKDVENVIPKNMAIPVNPLAKNVSQHSNAVKLISSFISCFIVNLLN